MKNGIYPQNYRSNRCLSDVGGIPSSKAKWILRHDDLRSLLNSFIADEKHIFVRTPDGSTSLCIDLENKDLLWKVDEVDNDGEILSIVDDCITLGWVTYNRNNGARVVDARDVVGADIEPYDFGLRYSEGYITKIRGENPEQIYINLKNKSYLRMGCNLEFYQISDDQVYLYGWHRNWLQCFDIESKKLVWQLETPASTDGSAKYSRFVVYKDVVFLTQHVDDLLCFSAKNEELIWQKQGEKKIPDSDLPHKHLSANVLMVYGDDLYMGCSMHDSGWLGCYTVDSAKEKWKIEGVHFNWPCISGDIIFDVFDKNAKLKAFDRYNGEQVWEAKEKMVAGIMVLISGNKVICNTSTGELYCYEWKDPYISPARPKT